MALFDIFKKKDKEPQEAIHSTIDNELAKNEYTTLLDSILGKQARPAPGAYSQTWNPESDIMDRTVAHPEHDNAYLSRMIHQFQTPEGMRFYPGQGESSAAQTSIDKSRFDAANRMLTSPSDSLSTDIVNQLMQHGGLFK